jgi:hypothetical protein
VVMRTIHEGVQAIASAVILERMPVRFADAATASLVSGAMRTLMHTPHMWYGSKHHFLTREFRLQFVDSSKVRSRVAQELRVTNLLRLKEVKDGTFMLLQRPSVRKVDSKRVYEPSLNDADRRDALIPGAYEENVATDLPSPFWCLLETSFEKSSVFVTVFSVALSAAQQEQMLEDIDAALMCLSQRANVSVLLSETSDTKRCHRMLYDPDPIAGRIALIREHCADLLIAEARREAAKFNQRGMSSTSGSGGSSGRSSISVGSKRRPAGDAEGGDSASVTAPAVAKPAPGNDSSKGAADASFFSTSRRPEEHLKALREKLKNLNQQGGALRADKSRGARPQSERLPELETKPRGPTTKEQTVKLDRDKMLDALQTKLEMERSSVLDEIAEAAGLSLPDTVDEFDKSIAADVNYGAGVPTNGRWQVDRLTDETDSSVHGRYRFPLLHTIKLRVNERVDPKEASEELEKELADLKLANRSAFVYEHDGTVFYLRLLRRDIAAESEHDQEKDRDEVVYVPAIFLAIYGIDTPSPEVRRALTRRLLGRLEKLALNSLSARLRKNLHFKLSRADVTFVCGTLDTSGRPFLQQPSSAAAFRLPPEVAEPEIFLTFMKQNLEQTKLVHELYFGGDHEHEKVSPDSGLPVPVRSPEVSATQSSGSASPVHMSNNPLNLLVPQRREFEAEQQDSKHIQLYYNFKEDNKGIVNMSARATPAQKNLDRTGRQYGEGIAFIFMSIVPGDSHFGSDISPMSFDAPDPLWPPNHGTNNSGPTLDLSARLVIRLWTKGLVKTPLLMTYIKVGVHQALHEYCLDAVCLRSLRFEISRVNLSFVAAAFSRALLKAAPSVDYVEVDTALPWSSTLAPWCTATFVNEMLALVDTLEYTDVQVCIEADDGRFVPHKTVPAEPFQQAVKQLPFERALVVLGIEMRGRRSGTFYPAQRSSDESMRRGDSFCLIICRGRVWAYTYNWSKKRVRDLHAQMTRLAYWMCHRCSLLGQILTSKMGLEPVSSSSGMDPIQFGSTREQPKTSDRSMRTYSVAVGVNRTSAFLPRQRGKPAEWTDTSSRTAIYTAADINASPLSVSECADQADWLATMLSSSQSIDQAMAVNTWPWLRLQVPPVLELVLQSMLPPSPSTDQETTVLESTLSANSAAPYGTSMTVVSQPKIGGASRRVVVPKLDIDTRDLGGLGVNRRRSPPSSKPVLPTFSQIDWYHGPDLLRSASSEMLSAADRHQFESAQGEFLGDCPPDVVKPQALADAERASEPHAEEPKISPTVVTARKQTKLVFSESKPSTPEPFASPFGQLQMSPPRARGGAKQRDGFLPGNVLPPQVRQRGFSLEDTAQTRVRAHTDAQDFINDISPQVDVDPHYTDAAQLTALLSDETLQRQMVKSKPVVQPTNRAKETDDILRAHGRQLQEAATCGRLEMRRHLYQSQMLRTLKSDTLGMLGLSAMGLELDQESIDAHRGNPAVSSSVDPDELEFTLANSARLLHACRWPLLFNEACSLLGASSVSWDQFRSMDAKISSNSEGTSHDEDIDGVVCQYRRLLESLLHFYTLYLRTALDFELVTAIPGDSMPQGGHPLPQAKANGKRAAILVGANKISIHDSPRVYLRKLVQGPDSESAVIVMQLEFDGIFVCANIFAPLQWPPGSRRQPFTPRAHGSRGMPRYSSRTAALHRGGSGGSGARAHPRNTVDDVATDVARRMCLQSFLWDYHLHYACRAMMLRPPFDDAKKAPFAVLPMLRMLTQHHTATAVGSAPAGAIGSLTHIRREQIHLPLPLIGARAALPSLVDFLCADDQLLGCHRLHHPADRGLGFCVLAQQTQTAWQYDATAEAAVGVDTGTRSGGGGWSFQKDCHFCVVLLELLSPGSFGSGPTAPASFSLGDDDAENTHAAGGAGDVGATLSCEIFTGMASDLERYYPQLGARQGPSNSRGGGSQASRAEAALTFVKEVVVGGARQYLRRCLWETAAKGRISAMAAGSFSHDGKFNSGSQMPSPLPFGPLGSPRYSIGNVQGDQVRHWASLCPSRELVSFDARLELLVGADGSAVPWARFVAHMHRQLGYDLALAPRETGHATVVLCHPRTPMHAVYLELALTEQALEQQASEAPDVVARALERERRGVALNGAAAVEHLLAFGDAPTIVAAASLLGQRSLSAGGGAESVAPLVVEHFANALILFVMEDVISLRPG